MQDKDEMEIKYSPHCQKVSVENVQLDLQIYEGDPGKWILEVVNEKNASTVWDDQFDTDKDAYEEFLSILKEEGVEAFNG